MKMICGPLTRDDSVCVAFGSVVQFFPDVHIRSLYPNVADYMERCAGRDAYAQAFGDQVQQFVLKNLSEEPPKKLFGVF